MCRSTDAAVVLCCQQGVHVAAATTQAGQRAVLMQCKELAACGAFQLSAFAAGVAQYTGQLQPLQQVQLLQQCTDAGMPALQLLEELLPSPASAAAVLCEAACSQEVCLDLLHSSSFGTLYSQQQQPGAAPTRPLQAMLHVLQDLLRHKFDAAATDEGESVSTAGFGRSWGGLQAGDVQSSGGLPGTLSNYVASLLQHVQDTAAQHQVLAVCLLQAAAGCRLLCDETIVSSWVAGQLQQLLQAQARASAAAAYPTAPPPAGCPVLCSSGWTSLAVEACSWHLLLAPVLQCVGLDVLLRLLQDQLSTAAASAQGLMQMCDIMACLEASDSSPVATLMAGALEAALQTGRTSSTLPCLLIAGRLVAGGVWGRDTYQAVLREAAAVCQQGHAAVAVPPLLRAFNLLLPCADIATLEAQVLVLRQLGAKLGVALQVEVAKTESILRDVLAHKQQALAQGRQKQQGTAVGQASYESYSYQLRLYMQQTPDAAGRRRLAPHQVAQWRLWGTAAQAFCDTFTHQPPDTLERAHACLCYIQELQEHKLCKAEQAEAFKAACLEFSMDLSTPFRALGDPPGPRDPIIALQALLNRLSHAVASGSKPALTTLCTRIQQQMQTVLHGGTLTEQLHKPQQHKGSSTQQPAVKRARMAPAAGAMPGAGVLDCTEVLGMFLAAYGIAVTAGGAAAAQDVNWDWQLEVLGVLQQLEGLHVPLLRRLLGSLHGSTWSAQECPQQALWHGSLLAWLSASKPQQLLLLSTAGPEANVTSVTAASPVFTWTLQQDNTSTLNPAGQRAAAAVPRQHVHMQQNMAVSGISSSSSMCTAVKLRGLELVQHQISCTSLATMHARCCAASFWAGYVGCVKTHFGQWCAGAHGPFGSPDTCMTQGTLAPGTQQQGSGAAGQKLLAYVPPGLATLLTELTAGLTADKQVAAAGGGDVGYDVVVSALQVANRAKKALPLKWACRLSGL